MTKPDCPRPKLTPAQCRAARGLIRWSQTDLANAAGITLSTVKNFETGRSKPITLSIRALASSLEGMGVVFIDDGSVIGAVMNQEAAT